jgi:rare lipoprotein A (peptidoglycan hydrolase)
MVSFRTLLSIFTSVALAGCVSNHDSHPSHASATETASQAASKAEPLHGFDPRAYYDKRAISMQRGAASYYADFFAGRLTANGERYDPNAYTAAHRTLPFGSVVRVVYEKTGAWVLVRVNDRGPYAKGRIIDLSRKAATRLSMIRDGVVRVRVELLERGDGKYVKSKR